MDSSNPRDAAEGDRPGRGIFATTQWSMVLAAGAAENTEKARAALEALCRAYWRPLFVCVRRQGYSEPDAQDLVQAFFARILARNDLQAVRRERGRFRSYLLASLKHFLINDWKRRGAEKRGGGQVMVALDDANREGASPVPAEERSPDRVFDEQWAIAMIESVLERLAGEEAAEGREQQFACLRGYLAGADDVRPQGEVAAELGLSEGAVKQAVFRLRQRYRHVLRAEVARTVATPGDVDAELRHLVAALRR